MTWNKLTQRLNPTSNSDFDRVTRLISNNIFFAARVVNIILDENSNNFEKLGGWNALGAIEYDPILSPTGQSSNIFPVAYPFFPNFKNYPLINEIIYVMQFPNQDLGNTNASQTSYYLNNISIWNHPHHNAYPSLANEPLPPQQKKYIETQVGSSKIVVNNNKQIFLGKTFKERAYIHPLLPFEGDIIQEGRWGNSIRLGSTVKDTPNNWSSAGFDGDPLIIIRNGQGQQTDQGWIPIVENINNDDSSIYIASTQTVPLEATSTSYVSYVNNTPTSPSKYSGKQIILNSGRLVFNANNDHMLLSAAKSINLNSKESVNIDTPTFIIQSDKMYLGSNKATEPLMLGTQTVNLLKDLISALDNFFTIMQTATTSPVSQGSPATLPTLNQSAVQVKGMLEGIKVTLNKGYLTSNSNYTV